jgi:hypothetical protein
VPRETIEGWDTTRFVKFLENYLKSNNIPLPLVGQMDELAVRQKLTVADELEFLRTTTTVGAAGSASALPATPDSYTYVLDPYGNVRLVPLYKPA